MNATQVIDFTYAGQRHWFEVYRYDTQPELHAALHTAGIKFVKDTVAYTDCYEKGEECGRMYLLDKSVGTLAHEAVHMTSGILARHGHTSMVLTTGELKTATDTEAVEIEEDMCYLVGHITSELYSRNRHF